MPESLKIANDDNYRNWITDIKSRIHQSQIKAAVRVNTEMLRLYWDLGGEIVDKKADTIWGSGFYNSMSRSLRDEFPNITGFSATNLKYMKRFYEFYSDFLNSQQAVDDLERMYSVPWGHHILIFTKCDSMEKALFYIQKTIENGWSRAMLLNFLDVKMFEAQGKAITNFTKLLPDVQSDLAQETLKDPYNFDFLTITEGYREKELEDALTANITKFLLELGQGFAYVGRQVPIIIGTKELAIDLLFYHLELRCYVVVELKVVEFDPSFIGQLGTYVAAVNHQRKKEYDNPTLGLLICKTKDNVLAKYSLEASSEPIGISEYSLTNVLPKNYTSALPAIEDIEKSLENM
jgi:predicted nuclease of restriction endonuclease-like (RecB) superfamily